MEPRGGRKNAIRAAVAAAASLAGAGLWASPAPLKIGVGRIVPVAYMDAQGRAVGFAVDVVNEAARREGIAVTWVPLVKGIADDLQSGTIDLVSAGMATEERKQKFYVSQPWWYQELAVLTRAGERPPVKRLGIQHVYVEFARPYFDPATFVIDGHHTDEPAAREARAVCKGTLDGAVITHGELHDLFLNRPEECNGVRLQSVDTAITYGLSIIARKPQEAVARRLRKRIGDLIMDGTLLRFAAAHPPISLSGAVHLQERIRYRYHNRIWATAAIIVALMTLFLGWFLWDRQRDLNRTRRSEARIRDLNRDLDRNVKQLETLLREKSILLKEVQHRVKNNLQVISSMAFLQANQVESEPLRQAMLAMRDRVKSMALIHEGLCFSGVLAEIDFAKYVDNLAPRLIQSHAPEAIELHADIDAVLRLDEATPCGLILNELLTNALKHAFPPPRRGDIWITFRGENGDFFMEVRDNGTGLPPGFSVETSHSLGMQIVTDLTAQLHGDLAWANEDGAVFRLRFRRQPEPA